jgi:hypothetical protein
LTVNLKAVPLALHAAMRCTLFAAVHEGRDWHEAADSECPLFGR